MHGVKMFCFGRFQLDDPDCERCSFWKGCADTFAGWGMGTLLSDVARLAEQEIFMGGVPDWVFEWDGLSDEKLMTMASEQPEQYEKYMKYNAGIIDE